MTSGAPAWLDEQRFHGRQCDRLMHRNHPSLAIAGRKQLQDAEDQSGDNAHAYKNPGMRLKLSPQQIERAH